MIAHHNIPFCWLVLVAQSLPKDVIRTITSILKYLLKPLGISPSTIPFKTQQYKFLTSTQLPSSTKSLSARPWGVAIGTKGKIFVIDNVESCVHTFSKNFKFQFSFGHNDLNEPRGAAVDLDWRLVVVDHGNSRLAIWNKDLEFVAGIPTLDKKKRPTNACGVSVSPNGDYYVSISHCDVVQIYSNTGILHSEITCGKGWLPFGSQILSSGNIVVACGDHKVRIFNPKHELVTILDGPSGELVFRWPNSIVIDRDGKIAVSDYCHRIVGFEEDGKFIFSFGEEGSGDRQIDDPYGIAMDDEGNIIVADRHNLRICVYG